MKMETKIKTIVVEVELEVEGDINDANRDFLEAARQTVHYALSSNQPFIHDYDLSIKYVTEPTARLSNWKQT